jgi:hypothetical protein
MESSDGLYSSKISDEGDESGSVGAVSVLSGDVDEQLNIGRVRESREPPRYTSESVRALIILYFAFTILSNS